MKIETENPHDSRPEAERSPPAAPRAIRSTFVPGTLADVSLAYQDAVSDHPARIKIRSAIKGVERVLGLSSCEISAEPEHLRKLMAKANPAAAGMRRRQWGEVRSLLLRGLRDAGVQVVGRRDDTKLSPIWLQTQDLLRDDRSKIGLGKFFRFCSRSGFLPAEVTEETFDRYRDDLEKRSLHPNPAAAYRQTVRFWNQAAAQISGWSKLVMPVETDPRRYGVPPEAFPQSFIADVEDFLAAGEHNDELEDDYAPRVRPITTKSRRAMIMRVASALIHQGTPPAEIKNLGTLCDLERVLSVLQYFKARHAEQSLTEGMVAHGWLLALIAQVWVHDASAAQAIKVRLRNLERKHVGRHTGVRRKNREKLRQFDHAKNFSALMKLPVEIYSAEARSQQPTYVQSVRVMYGLMIGILLHAPIRSKNLVELEPARNLLQTGKGARRAIRLHLPGSMTKAGREFNAPLPLHLLPLLDAWTQRHRARVCPHHSRYLFPNSRGALRNRNGLATQLSGFIERETGLHINLHLFRHLAAKIILEDDPNNMEVVRQVLGHASSRVTERAYAEFRSDGAFRTYDDTLQRITTSRIKRAARGRPA